MIIKSFQNRFNVMKNQGQHIQYVLDIGAYRGDFTETIHSVWPTAIVTQIEADERQRPWLKSNAIVALLGNEVKDSVEFYTLAKDKNTTGSSIFKELTIHYTDNTTVTVSKPMTTIDELYKKHKFAGKWREHGLVKMDTQGSELLILEGAKRFLAEKQPRFILAEVSIIQYNKEAPLITDYMIYMKNIGYKMVDLFDLSYGSQNELLQVDIMWTRE